MHVVMKKGSWLSKEMERLSLVKKAYLLSSEEIAAFFRKLLMHMWFHKTGLQNNTTGESGTTAI